MKIGELVGKAGEKATEKVIELVVLATLFGVREELNRIPAVVAGVVFGHWTYCNCEETN
jgi:hypothetical protein